jgi:hypothetical protein
MSEALTSEELCTCEKFCENQRGVRCALSVRSEDLPTDYEIEENAQEDLARYAREITR